MSNYFFYGQTNVIFVAKVHSLLLPNPPKKIFEANIAKPQQSDTIDDVLLQTKFLRLKKYFDHSWLPLKVVMFKSVEPCSF